MTPATALQNVRQTRFDRKLPPQGNSGKGEPFVHRRSM